MLDHRRAVIWHELTMLTNQYLAAYVLNWLLTSKLFEHRTTRYSNGSRLNLIQHWIILFVVPNNSIYKIDFVGYVGNFCLELMGEFCKELTTKNIGDGLIVMTCFSKGLLLEVGIAFRFFFEDPTPRQKIIVQSILECDVDSGLSDEPVTFSLSFIGTKLLVLFDTHLPLLLWPADLQYANFAYEVDLILVGCFTNIGTKKDFPYSQLSASVCL